MSIFTAKYTQTQRKAIEHAYCNLTIRPVAAIRRLAEAGELTYEGETIPAFEIPYASVRDIGATEERRRQGKNHSALVNKPHHDAIEIIRRRLVSVIDLETQRLEKKQRGPKATALDALQTTRVARALRELAALPAPGERGRTPGRPIAGEGVPAGEGKESHASSLAGSIVAAMQPPRINAPEVADRGRTTQPNTTNTENGLTENTTNQGDATADEQRPRQNQPQHNQATTENTGSAHAPQTRADTANDEDDDEPGDYARSQIQGLRVSDISVS